MSRRTIPIKDLNKVTSVDPDDEFALQLKDGSPAVAVKARYVSSGLKFDDIPIVNNPDADCYLLGVCDGEFVKFPTTSIPPSPPVPPEPEVPDIILAADGWWKPENITGDGIRPTGWDNAGLSEDQLDLTADGGGDINTFSYGDLNGYPTVYANAVSTGKGMNSGNNITFTFPFTIIYVAQDSGNFGTRDHVLSDDSARVMVRQAANPKRYVLNNIDLDVSDSYDNFYHVFICEMNGDATSVFTVSNTGALLDTTISDTRDYGSAGQTGMNIFSSTVHRWRGGVAEAVAINSALTPTDKSEILAFYESKFNLTNQS